MTEFDQNETYERRLVADLAGAAVREQRARRRWGIFFKALFFAYAVFLAWLFVHDAPADGDAGGGAEHAAVIDIQGVIIAGGENSAAQINRQLRAAFRNDNARGIILRVNSPGGSAVESNRIYKEIRRLREKYPGKKIYAVAGDFCASGGYFVAAATDGIYVDEASILGSIGVVFSGFGFVEAMEKLGIERRLIAAGEDKGMLDPFSPQRPGEVALLRDILADVHAVFIDAVKAGRGDALSDDPALFGGGVYSGADSVRLGLADGFNDVGGVARDLIGVDNVVYYVERDVLKDLFSSFVAGLPAVGGVWAGAR